MTDVVPFLGYEDCGAAADWLVHAFGFEETERFGTDGDVTHVTLRAGDGLVFLGHPGSSYLNPLHLRERCDAAARMYDVPWIVNGVWSRSTNSTRIASKLEQLAPACSRSPKRLRTDATTERRTSKGTAGCSPSLRRKIRRLRRHDDLPAVEVPVLGRGEPRPPCRSRRRIE